MSSDVNRTITDQTADALRQAKGLTEQSSFRGWAWEHYTQVMDVAKIADDEIQRLTDHEHDDSLVDGWWVCNSCGRRSRDNHAQQVEIYRFAFQRAEVRATTLLKALEVSLGAISWCVGRLEVADGNAPKHLTAALETVRGALSTIRSSEAPAVVLDDNPFPDNPEEPCSTCGHLRGAHNPYLVKPEKMEKFGFERTSCAYQPDCDCPGFPIVSMVEPPVSQREVSQS